MPDRSQSIPSPSQPLDGWRELEPFRESFLIYLPAELAAAARQLGEHVFDLLLEHPAPALLSGFSLEQEARAALADLRHTQGRFAILAHHLDASELDEAEQQLAASCGELAERLKLLAVELECPLL